MTTLGTPIGQTFSSEYNNWCNPRPFSFKDHRR